MAGRAPSNTGYSTEQKLSSGPRDMPDRGGPKPNFQSSSSRVDLSRGPHPVANLENRAKMGTVQSESARCDLSRSDSDPYGQQNAIDPGYNTGIKPNTGGGRAKRR